MVQPLHFCYQTMQVISQVLLFPLMADIYQPSDFLLIVEGQVNSQQQVRETIFAGLQ
jgi:hypothetical protein